ncbi:STAS domain-containing protein [Oceanospirillum sediminis]|uniref:Anti-sigma factor antagonist n=1 Tax=Oceanospirillum sediminis TaxID=2760088 RepID=A0A839IQL9_9GAMM|nr:STAS domain-containing protein [Oceanospirillum sediminis]MBB1486832.1 STAS domain-containing protein [Oceanospirillum sediminis]
MNIQTSTSNGQSVMRLNGRFDFNSHKVFRESYQKLLDDSSVKSIAMDLSQVEYLDSSALGMLLQLKEKADSSNKVLKLQNCSQLAKDVLAIANFDKLFEIT